MIADPLAPAQGYGDCMLGGDARIATTKLLLACVFPDADCELGNERPTSDSSSVATILPMSVAPETTEQGGRRLRELDALRGLAAIAVVLFHYFTFYPERQSEHGNEYLRVLFAFGYYGVHLFFVLSGFVILMSLERTAGYRRFLFARACRLYPAYWACILLTVAVVYPNDLDPPIALPWEQVLVNFSMAQEFLGVPLVDGVHWTLSRELAFYLVMAVVHALGLIRRIEAVTVIWLSVIVVTNLACWIAGASLDYRLSLIVNLQYAPLFIAGMIFYRARSLGFNRNRVAIIMAAPCLHLAFPHGDPQPEMTLLAYVIVLGVFALVSMGRMRWIACRPLIALGAVSYALYLSHEFAGFVLIRDLAVTGWPFWLRVCVTICLAIVAAYVITRWIERPAVRFLKSLGERP